LKKGVIWLAITFLMVTSMLLASCNNATTTTTTTTGTTTTKTTTTTPNLTTSTVSTTKPTSTTTTGSGTGKWWDKLGKPTYGGDITLSSPTNITGWDDYNSPGQTGILSAMEDQLTGDDWTLDPSIFAYQLAFRPSDYQVGYLGTSWEFTDPLTYVVHMRQGVHWQNVAPANGRELVADDIVFHFDRSAN
jgi:ABC-type transport system substrate-binding protein